MRLYLTDGEAARGWLDEMVRIQRSIRLGKPDTGLAGGLFTPARKPAVKVSSSCTPSLTP